MTLVTSISLGGQPLLLGDVLLSAKVGVGETVSHENVPTLDNLANIPFSDRNRRISGFRNKLSIIKNGSLAVGWTGELGQAKNTIDYLRTNLGDTPDISDIQEALGRVRPELLKFHRITDDRLDVTLVGCVIVSGKGMAIWRWNAATNQFHVGRAFAEGTGADAFKKLYTSRLSDPQNSEFPRLVAVEFAGMLLGYEILDRLNLQDFFGGGFDFIYHDREEFRRPKTLIHLFQCAIVEPRNPDQYHLVLIPTSYWQTWNDGWTVERIDFSGAQAMNAGGTWDLPIARTRPQHVQLITPEEPPTLTKDLVEGNFVTITTRFMIGNYEVYQPSRVYSLPHRAISLERHPSLVRLTATDYVFEKLEGARKAHFDSDNGKTAFQDALERLRST